MNWYYTAVVKYKNNSHKSEIYESMNYSNVKKYAKKHAFDFYYEPIDLHINSHVEIYKSDIPYYYNDLWGMYQKPVEIIYDHVITKIIIIQRWWRKLFIKRKIARFIISKYISRALWNPYTQIGKNRIIFDYKRFIKLN